MLAARSPHAIDTLAAWQGALLEIGTLGEKLGDSIEHDDLVGAIATMMQLRRARSAVSRVESSTKNLDELDLDAVRMVRMSVARTRGVDEIMRQWLGRDLPADGKLLASPIGIAVLADAMLPASWDFERDLVVLVGSELAPVAQLLADVGQHRIILLGEGDLPANAISARSLEEVVLAIRTMTPMAPTQVALRASTTADRELVDSCSAAARDGLADLRVHQNTVRSFSRTWIEQGAGNLPALARWPSVEQVGDAFAGKPMVIVAPGPSLARNIDQLRSLQGRAVICCFSHSLKPVLAAGVTPDVIVSVDPQDVRYHFAGCDTSRSYLVNGATVHPSLFDMPARGKLALAANGPIDDWLFDALGSSPQVVGGGSVATSAFSLALRWKCDPIIFLGLDLSFPGGQYYVATSSDGEARAELNPDGTMKVAGWSRGFQAMKAGGGPAAVAERVVELPGWHGGTVPSSFMFALFHRWFVETMRTVTTTVYNCTEGGSRIEGMQHVPFADVRASLGDGVDAQAVLAHTVASVDAERRTAKVAHQLASHLSRLRRARGLAIHANMLIARGGAERDLVRTEKALVDTLAPLEFASLLAQREVERAIEVAAHEGGFADFLVASSALLATVVDVIDQLVPILSATHAEMGRSRA